MESSRENRKKVNGFCGNRNKTKKGQESRCGAVRFLACCRKGQKFLERKERGGKQEFRKGESAVVLYQPCRGRGRRGGRGRSGGCRGRRRPIARPARGRCGRREAARRRPLASSGGGGCARARRRWRGVMRIRRVPTELALPDGEQREREICCRQSLSQAATTKKKKLLSVSGPTGGGGVVLLRLIVTCACRRDY